MTTIVVSFLIITSSPSVNQTDASLASTPADSAITFTTSIAPLLKANCTPCHFPGGTVHDQYPFEEYATAFALRKRLGTRIKEPEQQALLARWLDGGAKK